MCEVTDLIPETEEETGGKIVYANDVIATIAAIAAQDVPGIADVGGSSEFSLFGKKNITKGIKIELGAEEVCVDVYVNVRYAFKIREVCEKLQYAIKDAIETMTGLNVVEVNVFVQAVVFDKPAAEKPKEEPEKVAEPAKKEAEPVAEEVVAEVQETETEAAAEAEAAAEETVPAETDGEEA
ncbi:MAG: Asp23/Gls24 family envelope stress response protein [Clostridia bacterium]|nr:Asp23/Gls24 family envelope stress response protein [Clostridia bacterium]